MGKNIRDYINSGNSKPLAQRAEQDVRNDVNTYGKMSEQELMCEMARVAQQSKAQGSLDDNSIKQFYAQVSPMLTEQQRNKLKQLINTLK